MTARPTASVRGGDDGPPPDPVVAAWLAGDKLTEIARRFNLTRDELYERLRDHPARRARWN